MPIFKITEVDNTGLGQLEDLGKAVYIPGYYKQESAGLEKNPVWFYDVKEFDKYFGENDIKDASYYMARRLLQLGLRVLYHFKENVVLGNEDLKLLADRRLYPIDFISTGGYPQSAEIIKKLLEVAYKRGDCTVLVDFKEDVQEVDAIQGKLEELDGDDNLAEVGEIKHGEVAACFVPWFKNEYDVKLPGSAAYLFAYARSIVSNPEWYAVAGAERGVVPECKELLREYTSAEVDKLECRDYDTFDVEEYSNDNMGIAVNVICEVKPFGNLIWGNRTLLKGMGTELLKASAFLNVRVLVNEIKKALYRAATKYAFNQNTEVLWVNFKSEVIPLLDKAVSGNGLVAYDMKKVATDKKARLKVKVVLIPIEGVEDFEINVYLEDSVESLAVSE